jgi:two-component system cell cycle response regulator
MTVTPAKIVVVDDDRTQLTALSLALERQGYLVAPVQDAEDVTSVLARENPDLLMLDILMPKVDGLQLLRRIKADERWRDLPVLMISVLAPEEATATSLGLGAADFISKPFRAKELAARVEAQLRAGRVLRDARLEARRAAVEASVRSEMLDILHEVTAQLEPNQIYRVLANRVLHALRISRCSIVLAKPGEDKALVVVAAEKPELNNLEIRVADYPEISRALALNQPVLVRDVAKDPLFEAARQDWLGRGVRVETHSAIAVPFGMHNEQSGVFFLRTMAGEPPLDNGDLLFAERIIGTAVGVIERAYRLEDAQFAKDQYAWLATTDALTDCMNRRGLLDRLEAELERVQRYGEALSLMMIDLDHFKKVNDSHGHLAGDEVLRQIGALLRGEVRAVDTVARYGGEEFVILLPETTQPGAVALAERIRERVAQRDFSEDASMLSVTISVGVTTVSAGEVDDPEGVLGRVDAALYRAKRAGRNLVRS